MLSWSGVVARWVYRCVALRRETDGRGRLPSASGGGRLARARHPDLIDYEQLAIVTIHGEDVDLFALGVRDIDDRLRCRVGHGFPSTNERARQD